MLYDQAQLALAYVTAYQITGHNMYAGVTQDILDYVEQKLRASQGGFYSAEDADSLAAHNGHEKSEGAFYVWEHKGSENLYYKLLIAEISYKQKSCNYWAKTRHYSANCTMCVKTAMSKKVPTRTTSSRARIF